MTAEGMFGETTFAGEPDSDANNWVPMGGAIGDAVVFGPAFITDDTGGVISQPGVYVQPLVLEVVDRSDLTTVLSALPDTFGRSFDDEANDTGSGALVYANTDTAAAAALALGRLVNFYVYGNLAFTMLVESKHRITFTEAEEVAQLTTTIGRGHLAVTEPAVVYPSRGTDIQPIEEDRPFNWATPAPVYDDSGWAYAHVIMDVAAAQLVWGGWTPPSTFVPDWPDPTTKVIWSPLGTHSDAPAGTCYFRKEFTVPSDGYYLLYGAADNEGDLYLDGQLVISLGGFAGNYTYVVFMTAGSHTIAVRVENFVQAAFNPAGLVVALFTIAPDGEPDTLIMHTDATWRAVFYPTSPPGMYVGEVIHLLFAEAVARGVLGDVTLMFGEFIDSAGQPWPETLDIATKVGTTYLVFLIELTATYIDLWMKPGTLELYAWNKGTRGRSTTVTLHGPTDDQDPTTGNMTEQAHTVLA